jgi:hypothetical protein
MNLANRPPLGLKAGKPKKDPNHLARVAELPCCICEAFGEIQEGRTYVHHTICGRFGNRKTPDREVIPLCWHHHQGPLGIHASRDAWVRAYGSDRDYIAATLDKLGV